jgi:hypothetical protein
MKSLLVIGHWRAKKSKILWTKIQWSDREQWGEPVVERLSKDLKKGFPDYCDNLLQKFR